MLDTSIASGQVCVDLEADKKMVMIFKKSGFNSGRSEGLALLTEVPPRFGTTCDVLQQFIKLNEYITGIIDVKPSDAAHIFCDHYSDLVQENKRNGTTLYPALDATATCFAPILHAQTMLEAAKTPTIILVLPVFDRLKTQLNHPRLVLRKGFLFEIPHVLTRELAEATLTAIGAFQMYYLWCTFCILHPGLKTILFAKNIADISVLKSKHEAIVRCLCATSINPEVIASDMRELQPGQQGNNSFLLRNRISFLHPDSERVELEQFKKERILAAEQWLL